MSRRKKKFPCGHKGYGQVCHHCVQLDAAWEERKRQKNAWEATFSQDSDSIYGNYRKMWYLKLGKSCKDCKISAIIEISMVNDYDTIALLSVSLSPAIIASSVATTAISLSQKRLSL
jgi:hypothetical protein